MKIDANENLFFIDKVLMSQHFFIQFLRKCKKTLQKLLVPEILACPLPRRRAVVNLEKIKGIALYKISKRQTLSYLEF